MAIKKKVIGSSEAATSNTQMKTTQKSNGNKFFQEFSKHIMTGISYMIPVLIMGGLIGAFSQIIPYVIFKLPPDMGITDALASGNYTGFSYQLLYLSWLMAKFGFTLFGFAIPIFSAFTANSIGGKSALISGFIGGYLASNPIDGLVLQNGAIEQVSKVPSGFLGALLIAFSIGYIVKWLNSNIKLSRNWMAFKTTFLVPLLAASITMALMIFVITPFGGWINELIKKSLEIAGTTGTIAYSAILSAATAFDLGGPVNKAAGFVAAGFTTEKVLPITARTIAIVVPSFGLGLSTFIDKWIVGHRVYDKQFREIGKTAVFLGFMGISEGSIPFALERPKFVIPLYVGGAMAGSLTAVFLGAVQWFPESAIWAWPLVDNLLAYIIGLLVGTIIIALGNIFYREHLIKKGELEIL